MERFNLDPEALEVTSFAVEGGESAFAITLPDPFCCTGCDSGCGIFPTASGCASGGGNTWEWDCTMQTWAAVE